MLYLTVPLPSLHSHPPLPAAVGFEDPETHAIYWFNLGKGPVHYIPQLQKYFKMDVVA